MAKFFGLEDLAMERMSLQQETTELNSSESKRSFFLDKGSKLSFRALTTILSTLSTRIKVVMLPPIPPIKVLGFLGGGSVSADPEARRKFEEIRKAYEVLSDPEKRAKYDKFEHAYRSGRY